MGRLRKNSDVLAQGNKRAYKKSTKKRDGFKKTGQSLYKVSETLFYTPDRPKTADTATRRAELFNKADLTPGLYPGSGIEFVGKRPVGLYLDGEAFIAEASRLLGVDAKPAVDAISAILVGNVMQGNMVEFPGLGEFSLRLTNPKIKIDGDGEYVLVGERVTWGVKLLPRTNDVLRHWSARRRGVKAGGKSTLGTEVVLEQAPDSPVVLAALETLRKVERQSRDIKDTLHPQAKKNKGIRWDPLKGATGRGVE